MKLLRLVLAALLTWSFAAQASAAECGGVQFPARTQVGGTTLVLNGMGIREATMFNVDVYVAALYVESRSRNASALLDTSKKKKLVLRMVRDVSRSDMVEALRDGVRANAGSGFGSMQDRVQRLASWIPALDEGDTVTFTYQPGEGVEVKIGQRVRGTIEGEDFARAFFAIWLGPNPPNEGLKRGLLGGSCG